MHNFFSRLRAITGRSRVGAFLLLAAAFQVAAVYGAVAGMGVAFLGANAMASNSQSLFADGRLSTVNTFATAKTQNSKLVGELFSKMMVLQTSNKDILGQMEGPEGSGKPICLKTDLTKGGGDSVNFSVMSRPGGEGALGEDALEAEALDFNSFKVKLDIFRHGLGRTEKFKMFLAAGMSAEEAFMECESEYFALKRQNDMFMLWRLNATASNTIRPNDRATTNALLTGDTLNTTLIGDVASLLKTRGAPPASITRTKVGKFANEVKKYIILASDRALNPLKSNSAYLQALREAGNRGNENLIWSGGYADWDGNMLFHYDVVHEDTRGPIGSPIEPEALLGTAIASATTTVAITGGGRTSPSSVHKPFKWFKGYAYQGVGQDAPSADSATYYVVIYNVTGADAGKFGIYAYTGSANDGNQIGAVTSRLGASATGIAVTSLAGITYSASLHTDAHPTGSRIIQVNSKCVPYAYGIGFGAMAGLRAYGGPAIKPIRESGDWEFKKGMGFQAVYGQGLAKDTTDTVRNYALIEAAYRPQGCGNLPTVTS